MKKIFAILMVTGFLTACNDTNTNRTELDTVPGSNNAVVSPGSDTTGADADTATTKPAGLDTTAAAGSGN